MQNGIDWKRVRSALLQESRRAMIDEVKVFEAIEMLPAIVDCCGEFSRNRRIAQRIGRGLIKDRTTIIIPVCPDYSHENGHYTFRSLSNGVSLITTLHVAFLKKLVAQLPKVDVIFLLADHEADDEYICRAVGKTRDEFGVCVLGSVQATKGLLSPYGWRVELMTSFIPDLVAQEHDIAMWMDSNKEFAPRIERETWSRAEMYRKISGLFTGEEMKRRTIKTAAQYMALGRFAARNYYLVCNHTTTNLSWYTQTEVGILHNPVSIY